MDDFMTNINNAKSFIPNDLQQFITEYGTTLTGDDFISTLAASSLNIIKAFARQLSKQPYGYIQSLLAETHISKKMKNMSAELLHPRLNNAKWLLRQLREIRGKKLEWVSAINKEVGHGCKHQYISPVILANYEYQKQQTEQWLNSKKVWQVGKNNLATPTSLASLAQCENSRRNEIYADCLVIQMKAEKLGLECALGTLTSPGHHHFNPQNGNCTWDGSSSRESANYQYAAWRACYNRLKEANIFLIGMRVFEVHKDGTPHLHVAIFTKPSDRKEVIKHWNNALNDYGIRKKGRKLTFSDDCPEGTEEQAASTYVMKYITKEFHLKAWFSIENGGLVRQFSTFGMDGYKSAFNLLYRARRHLARHPSRVFQNIYQLLTDETRPISERKFEFATNWAKRIKVIRMETINCYNERVKTKVIGVIDTSTLDIFHKVSRTLKVEQILDISNQSKQKSNVFSLIKESKAIDLSANGIDVSNALMTESIQVCKKGLTIGEDGRLYWNYSLAIILSDSSMHTDSEKLTDDQIKQKLEKELSIFEESIALSAAA